VARRAQCDQGRGPHLHEPWFVEHAGAEQRHGAGGRRARGCRQCRPALLQQRRDRLHSDVRVGPGALGIDDPGAAQARQPRLHVGHLVHLLLVLQHQRAEPGLFGLPGQPAGGQVGAQEHRHQPGPLARQHREHRLHPRAARDPDGLAVLQAGRAERAGERLHGRMHARPGPAVPDAMALLQVGRGLRVTVGPQLQPLRQAVRHPRPGGGPAGRAGGLQAAAGQHRPPRREQVHDAHRRACR
jgi:hypothetical protein